MTTILVTGASGQFGRLVLNALLNSGKVAASDLVAASRSPEKLSDVAEKGVAVRTIDFDRDETLPPAFAGIDTALIISTDALGEEGKRLAQHRRAVAAAKAAGVKRLVYISLPNAENSAVSFAPDHLGTEEAIKESGLAYTILRNSWYMENLFMSLPSALASGHWYSAAGDGRIPYVARADLAAAAAGALLSDERGNEIVTLTGPVAYTVGEVAALVSDATGKPLTVVPVTDEQLAEGMAAHGVPGPFIPTLVSFDRAARLGQFDLVTDDVSRLAGRTPTSLTIFLEANKGAFGA
jgi:NAD(P)H dehydrogenase (quinone)